MRWTVLLCITLLTQACANQTERAMEAVEADLPSVGAFSPREVSFRNIESYPGKVLCGEYTTSKKAAESSFKLFIYLPSGLNRHPTEEDNAVFCTTESQQGLYQSTGINFSGDSKATLLLISKDFKQLAAALEHYRADNFSLPTPTQGLDALLSPSDKEPKPRAFREGGYITEVPKDPWEAPYLYIPPALAGVQGQYKLLTLGADGKEGGKSESADVALRHVKHIDHVNQLH